MKRRCFLTACLFALTSMPTLALADATASIGFEEMYEGNPILGLQIFGEQNGVCSRFYGSAVKTRGGFFSHDA